MISDSGLLFWATLYIILYINVYAFNVAVSIVAPCLMLSTPSNAKTLTELSRFSVLYSDFSLYSVEILHLKVKPNA